MPDTLHARLRAAVEERLAVARAAAAHQEVYGVVAAVVHTDEIRRCEALLRVVETCEVARDALAKAERHRGSGHTRETLIQAARLRLVTLEAVIRDLAAGEGIEVGDG